MCFKERSRWRYSSYRQIASASWLIPDLDSKDSVKLVLLNNKFKKLGSATFDGFEPKFLRAAAMSSDNKYIAISHSGDAAVWLAPVQLKTE